MPDTQEKEEVSIEYNIFVLLSICKHINHKTMNKTVFILVLFGFSSLLNISRLSAQTSADPTISAVVLDDKSQKKVDQARVDLAKSQQKLNKEIVSYEKAKAKHDKDLKQGQLSPVDKEKGEKKLTKLNMSIGKLKKNIADTEAFLAKYNL